MSIYYEIDSNTDSFPTGAKSKDFYISEKAITCLIFF
jgi:hypothetical protein